MQPTGRALSLHPGVQSVLADIRSIVSTGNVFDPATTTRTFRLSMSDAMSVEALPFIVRRIRREAPNLDLVISTSGPQESCRRIADDEIDLAIGVFPHVPKELSSRELYRDTLICVADKRNNAAEEWTHGAAGVSRFTSRHRRPQPRHRHSGRRNSRFDGDSAPDRRGCSALSECARFDPRHRPRRAYPQALAFGVSECPRTSLCSQYPFRCKCRNCNSLKSGTNAMMGTPGIAGYAIWLLMPCTRNARTMADGLSI